MKGSVFVAEFELPQAAWHSWPDVFDSLQADHELSAGPQHNAPAGCQAVGLLLKRKQGEVYVRAHWVTADGRSVLTILQRRQSDDPSLAREVEAIIAAQGWRRIRPVPADDS